MPRRLIAVIAAVAASLAMSGPAAAAPRSQPGAGFVVRKGDQLVLDGKKFRFGGTNNYYLRPRTTSRTAARSGRRASTSTRRRPDSSGH